MPRGGGPTFTYSLPAIYLAVPGTLITAAQHNTPLEDIASTFNTAWPVTLGGTGGTSAAAILSGDNTYSGSNTFEDDLISIGAFIVNGTQAETLAAQSDNLSLDDTTNVLNVTLTGDQSITGITGGVAGRIVVLKNVDDTDTLTVVNDATSTATNRFELPGAQDFDILPKQAVILQYSGTRWNFVSQTYSSVPSDIKTSCFLSLDGSDLKLSRFNGYLLTIGGSAYSIPSAGVTLSATGLTPDTLYYIYAYMDGATMTLEASETSYAVDTTTGINIKSGDSTRTFVGMARPVTGPAWVDSATQRFVRSFYNRGAVDLVNKFTVDRTTTSTTLTEINSEIRCEFISWSGEMIDIVFNGTVGASSGGIRVVSMISVDGATANDEFSTEQVLTSGSERDSLSVRRVNTDLTEGYHYATLIGRVSSGTGGWYQGATGPSSPAIAMRIG